MLICKKYLSGFWEKIRQANKKLQTEIYKIQKKVAEFVRRHRTIKLLHLFRKYSAFAVVVSSATLVSVTNMAAEGQSGGLLSGQWKQNNVVKNDVDLEAEKAINNELTPVSVASRAVNPDTKDDEKENLLNDGNGKIISAPNSPVLKDPEEDGGVKIYTVKEGDTVSSIAAAHHITVNTILWANDIENVDSIMPGDKIFILPVAGLTHIVKKGENLDKIAKEFKADKDKIIAFNDLPANGEIKEGEEIIIPGGQKETPTARRSQQRTGVIARRSYATPTGGTPKISGWKKLEGKAGTGHRFPYGYCTWYVAQKRYVPWGGNAGTWLYHAKVRGYKTGKTPRKGAIMVSSESWLGHVAIVEKVGKGTITVSEMNYKGWAKVSRRTISTKSRFIKGYIY